MSRDGIYTMRSSLISNGIEKQKAHQLVQNESNGPEGASHPL